MVQVVKRERKEERKEERPRVVKRTNSRKQLYEKREEGGTEREVNKVNFDVVPFESRLSRTG